MNLLISLVSDFCCRQISDLSGLNISRSMFSAIQNWRGVDFVICAIVSAQGMTQASI